MSVYEKRCIDFALQCFGGCFQGFLLVIILKLVNVKSKLLLIINNKARSERKGFLYFAEEAYL